MSTTPSQTLYPDWKELVTFASDGPRPHHLIKTGQFTALIAGLEPGQKIPPHPEASAIYHFLEGTGWMIVDDQRFPVKPGATVVVPQGASRGMEAETQLAFIAAKAS
jgi:quercetin dioxygenase-like cupin family protein